MSIEKQRELLELAAKAAGYDLKWHTKADIGMNDVYLIDLDPSVQHFRWKTHPYNVWDPINDDGDALRLAVRIGIQITQYRPTDRNTVGSVSTYYDKEFVESYKPAGEMAATRRAIVRAAAMLGSKK